MASEIGHPAQPPRAADTGHTYVYDPDDEVVGGDIDPDHEYTEAEINAKIVIPEREQSRIHEFMDQINPRQKTLVFCATQNHAAAVRDYINQIKDIDDPHYCERVTANDGALGEQHLREFQDNERSIPTILTTSQKLSTGVDDRCAEQRHLRVLAYIRFIVAPLMRSQPADKARMAGLSDVDGEMRSFLEAVLSAYEVHGVDELALGKIGDFLKVKYGGTNGAKRALGGIPVIKRAFMDIQAHLYAQ